MDEHSENEFENIEEEVGPIKPLEEDDVESAEVLADEEEEELEEDDYE